MNNISIIPNYEVNVSLRSNNEIEFKIYSGSGRRVRYEVTMMTPHCLGLFSRESLMDDVRIMTRIGINRGWSLEKVIETYTDSFVEKIEKEPDPENMICLMGCTLKSSIRRSKKGCPSVEIEKIIELIANMRSRVKDVKAVEVMARLEEFILMSIHITASRMAICDPSARKIAMYAQERLGSMGLFSPDGTAYSYQWHCLKYYFYNHIVLAHKITTPSWFWTDVMGTLAAGLAMSVAVLLAWIAQKTI